MEYSFGQNCLVQVAHGFHPITVYLQARLGQDWLFLPAYLVFFAQVFALSALLWRQIFRISVNKVPLLASCLMSSVHGMVCVAAAFPELRSWDSLKLDLPNTPLQSLQLQFSLAYLIADTGYMLAFTPTDYLFLAHHALAGLYLYAVLALRRGAISALLIFFLGEVTSPLLNAFTVSKELKEEKSWAARMFAVASPMFTVAFVVTRTLISPPIMGWFLYTLWFRSPGIPGAWSAFMGALVTLGMAGSQVWSYKLVRGWAKARRKAQHAATRKTE